MKKLFYFVCSLVIVSGFGEVQGAKKKKRGSYLSSFSLPSVKLPSLFSFSVPSVPHLPSVNALNPFAGGKQKTSVALASDQKSSGKKKKRKNSMVTVLANAGRAVATTPAAAWLIKKTKNFGNGVLSIGPMTVRYASSEQGQSHIKSVLKNSLHYGLQYGVPIAGVIGGVKYLDRNDGIRSAQLQQSFNNSLASLTGDVQNLVNEQQKLKNDLQQNLQNETQDIKNEVNRINTAVSGYDAKIDVTNNALTKAADNLDNLHSYLKDEKDAEVNTDIGSLEDARKHFSTWVNPEKDIQAIIGSQNFKVHTSQRVIGKNGQYYRGVSVEVTAETYDDPTAWVHKGDYTYQNTLKKYENEIGKAEELFDNTFLDLWYRNEKGEPVSLSLSGKDEVG